MSSGTVDREIRITASDTGVFDKLMKMKEGALAMGRGIAEDARKQATSSRELIKLMNDEIALIEKRNKLNQSAREAGVSERLGKTSPEFKSEMQKISVESKEDKMQSDLLKQILGAILKTSQEEVTSDRDTAKSQIASDKQIDATEDHEEALRQMFTKQIVKDTEPLDGESKEESKGRSRAYVSGMNNFIRETDAYTMGFSGASNLLQQSAPGVKNKLGQRSLIAGGLAFGLAGMTIAPASDLMESQGDIFRATGDNPYDFDGRVKDMTTSQANKRSAQLNLAAGERLDPETMRTLLNYERSQGVNSEQLAKFTRFSGGEGFTNDPTLIMGMFKSIMNDFNLNKSRTNDLLEASLSLQEAEYMSTGKASGAELTGIINRLMSGQVSPDARRAGATAQRLDSLAKGGDTQSQAIKFSEYQRKYPGRSYVDFLREQEKGVGGEIDDLVISRIINNKELNDDQKRLSMRKHGLTIHDADEVLKAGGVSPMLPKDMLDAEGNVVFDKVLERGRAAEQGGENVVTKSAAGVTDAFALIGSGTISLVEKMVSLGNNVDTLSLKMSKATFPESNNEKVPLRPSNLIIGSK